jgi:hypothetical protein
VVECSATSARAFSAGLVAEKKASGSCEQEGGGTKVAVWDMSVAGGKSGEKNFTNKQDTNTRILVKRGTSDACQIVYYNYTHYNKASSSVLKLDHHPYYSFIHS